jgi:hypothetical protein
MGCQRSRRAVRAPRTVRFTCGVFRGLACTVLQTMRCPIQFVERQTRMKASWDITDGILRPPCRGAKFNPASPQVLASGRDFFP